MDLLEGLNPAQLSAVTHGDGPLLIVAGVGTGKTTVITRRIAWLISQKRALPSEILALTFTDKAAAEMEERVDLLVPYGYVDAEIGTFHSFCDRVLRENAVHLGLTPSYRVLTEAEQAIFLKDQLFNLPLERFRPLGNPLRNLQAILTLFSRAKDEDVTPTDYEKHVDALRRMSPDPEEGEDPEAFASRLADQSELAGAYAAYQHLLAEHGYVDFGDQITLTLQLFRDHPDILARYRKRFRYILVDEFQDTNYAQFELLKLLANLGNLTVCGDDDQSIYKFRGAAISNILGFQESYPNAQLVVLKENYRSTQAILDAAYRLIQHNNPDRLEVRAGIAKQLRSNTEAGRAPHLHHFESLTDESDAVAEAIAARVADEDRSYSDFAILVRSNAQATPFLRSLNMLRIPWRFSGSRGLYDQEEIRTAIALLRTLADPGDDPSLHYLASSSFYRMRGEDLAAAAGYARRKNRSLLQVLRQLARGSQAVEVAEETRARAETLIRHLDPLLDLASKDRTGEVLYRFLSETTGEIERLSNSSDLRDAQRVRNIAKLFEIIERFAQVARYDRVRWFVDYLDALVEAGDNPAVGDARLDADAVHVLTIHQAKGLEFPVVFLVGLVTDRFPSRARRDPIPLPEGLVKDLAVTGDFHRQEERRLFYVGLTRAKEDVYLTSSQDYGGKRPKKPSLFVSEALDIDASELKPQRREPLEAIERIAAGDVVEEDVAGSVRSGQAPSLFPLEDPLLRLSHRQIDDYLTCPLKYRYIHSLRVPIRIHHAVAYGSAVHHAVRLFNTARISGERLSIEELGEAFRKQWRAEGFLTPEHEELRLNEGIRALEAFHAFETDEGRTPALVESRFSIVEGSVRLVGVFDRVDIVDGAATIIDYKTSDVRTEEQANRRSNESLQLALYAIAYEHKSGALPASLELRFLTPQGVVVGRAEPSAKRLEKARTKLAEAEDGIRSGHFPGEPVFRACTHCPYAGICPSRRSD